MAKLLLGKNKNVFSLCCVSELQGFGLKRGVGEGSKDLSHSSLLFD
jgi:hypothetical protein